MGIRERQERDRETVRRAILDAARDLFVDEGYRNVSIRKIAERIEYSPAAIYSYFPSKDDIFFALAEEGFRLLSARDEPANLETLEPLDPLDRIRAVFWRLYEFSRDHPEYFALMFVDRSVPRISREYERFTFVRDMKTRIVDHIQHCIDAKSFPPGVNPLVAFRLLTMGLLGVAVMRLSDRLAPGENADDLARDVLNVMLAGLQSGIPLQSSAAACTVDGQKQLEVEKVTHEGVAS
jgi:AcrR family transcriptional regulator